MAESSAQHSNLAVGDRTWRITSLALPELATAMARLPYTHRVLLENLLRHGDGERKEIIRTFARWDPRAEPTREIGFRPARVLMQDFTGVAAVVDLAAMRQALADLGGDPRRVDPLSPAELVIDHSVQVDRFASPDALADNIAREYERNGERYAFLKWGQQTFANLEVVPPGAGIVHQVNLEHLARVVFSGEDEQGRLAAWPDTLVGTDSHTTMVGALGVLGWGVGGIEAEAALLGQPVSMLLPQVVGCRLTGTLAQGATATDLVLTVVERLRKEGVVGRFVEFCGPGLDGLPLADRATIANMAPEYGATCGFFPVDAETLAYLRLTGRSDEQLGLVEAYTRAQGLYREPGAPEPEYSSLVEIDLAAVEPSLAGPRRPQDRVALGAVKESFRRELAAMKPAGATAAATSAVGEGLSDGAVVIAAITSCTNTSNPAVMLGAGLLARNAVQRGLTSRPWVKTSLAPGSKVVTDYLARAGLMEPLEQLGFHLVGYGCTTCIGNSGPLPAEVSAAVEEGDLVVCSVLSGNRNFEGRVHGEVRMNYLASPPLVVAYALAGRMDLDLKREPLGRDREGRPVFLSDLWPDPAELQQLVAASLDREAFHRSYSDLFAGSEEWRRLPVPEGELYSWPPDSTYIRKPPFFDGMGREPEPVRDIVGARVLALLGDSVTTDHISPAGAIRPDTPAGTYLAEQGVRPARFNSLGSRRGNHEVMMRGTFANPRLRNRLAPGTEGGFTRHQPSGEEMTIYDASCRYRRDQVPLLILAGREYGSGSSRDWAAKGPLLLGVKAVLAESYERIHRSNLVGMGILPLQFPVDTTADQLGLTGDESYAITGLAGGGQARQVQVTATVADGREITFAATVRIDTPQEYEYWRHGGILRYVLRQLI